MRVPFIMMIINDYHQQRGQQCTWSSFDGHCDRQHDHIWFRADGQCESVLSGRFFLRRWQVRGGIAGGPKRQNSVQIHESIWWSPLFSLGIIIIIIIMMIVIIMIITKGENGRVGVKLCLVVKLAAGAKMGAGGGKHRRNFMKKNWHQRKPNVKKHKVNMIIIFIINMILIVSAVGIFLWFRSRSKFAKSIECQKFTRS